MGDILVLANNVTVSESNNTTIQKLEDVLDISAYTNLQLQVGLLGRKGSADGMNMEVVFFTSMSNTNENLPEGNHAEESAWVETGEHVTLSVDPDSPTPLWKATHLSVSENTMLRYLRWQVRLPGGQNPMPQGSTVTISITGIGRTA